MVEEDRYRIDIVTPIEAALARVGGDLLRRHLQHCVRKAMTSKNSQERVIDELVDVFRRQG